MTEERYKEIIDNETSWVNVHEMKNTIKEMVRFGFISSNKGIVLINYCTYRMEVIYNEKRV